MRNGKISWWVDFLNFLSDKEVVWKFELGQWEQKEGFGDER